MKILTPQEKGGQLTAALLKKRAEEAYNKNPKICLNCQEPISLNGRRPSKLKKNKFCSTSCAATYNNAKFPKKESKYHKSSVSVCENCGSPIFLRKRSRNTYYKRKRCDKCLYVKGTPSKKLNDMYLPKIGHKTIQEVFDSCKTYQSARSQILKHALITYHLSDRPKECAICSYKKHFQVCHRKSVASFKKNTLINVVNDLDNLFPLCPTHHWEYDHNSLDTINISKIK